MKQMRGMGAAFFYCVVTGLVVRAADAPSAPVERPNILWLVSEDNCPYLGCYGDPLARTPNLDKLASKGIIFERCYSMPVCAPSRFSLISGLYPASCGPAEHMRASGKIPAWLKGFPSYLRKAGYYTTNHQKRDYNAPFDVDEIWNDAGKSADWSGRPSPSTPFFSVYNHEVCHESCLFPEKKAFDFAPTDPARVRVPPYQPDTPEVRADIARQYDCITEMDRQCGEKLRALEHDGLAENTIVFYYGDNGGITPRSKRFLEDTGTHVPLIVCFPPKWQHLAPAAPGSRVSTPVHFVDFAPTVLALAGIERPAYLMGTAFAGDAAVKPRRYVFCSRDRMDGRYDMSRSVNDGRWLYIRHFRPDIPYVTAVEYMFKARGYQSWARLAEEGNLTPATAMFWGRKPPEELYDLAADPDNVRNLIGQPAQAEQVAAMRRALAEHMTAIRDNGLVPEGSDEEGYDASRRPGGWPVEKTLETALLASSGDPANLASLVSAASDAAMSVRWWAAIGFGILGNQASSAEPVLQKLLADDSVFVRVAAADALAQQGKVGAALPVLQQAVTGQPSLWGALQACNVLDRLGPAAKPVMPVLTPWLDALPQEVPQPDPRGYLSRVLGHLKKITDGRVQPLAGQKK